MARKVTTPAGSNAENFADTTHLAAAEKEIGEAGDAMTIVQPDSDTVGGQTVARLAGTPVTGVGTKSKTLYSVLTVLEVSDITRVSLLSETALNDIPDPNFSATAANIKGCTLPK